MAHIIDVLSQMTVERVESMTDEELEEVIKRPSVSNSDFDHEKWCAIVIQGRRNNGST